MHKPFAASKLLLAVALCAPLAAHADANCPPPGDGGGDETWIQGVPYIVGYKPASGTLQAAPTRSSGFTKAAAALGVDARRERAIDGHSERVRLRGRDRAAIAQAVAQLSRRSDVAYVVEDVMLGVLAAPNDPDYGSQWALKNTAAGIMAESAWDTSHGQDGIIAILDTGITSHPDLNGNVLPYGADMVSDASLSKDGDGRDANATDPGDSISFECGGSAASSWHGTKVAGIAAAVTDNQAGIAGVARSAKILPVRVLGAGGKGYLSDVADGIRWAAGGTVPGVATLAPHQVADVINLSLGFRGTLTNGTACGPVEQAAIDFANQQGVVVVAAAGNNNGTITSITPASCAGVITVAASDINAQRAIYSGTGLGSSASNRGAGIDLTAPGKHVRSTTNLGTDGAGAASYAPFSGTSAAAPHVAGVVALMQSHSQRDPSEVLAILAATDRPNMTCTGCSIPGVINASAALAALGTSAPPSNPVASFNVVRQVQCKAPFTFKLINTSTDADGDITSYFWDLGGGLTSTTVSAAVKLGFNETRTATLTVTDSRGATSTTSRQFSSPGGCIGF